MGRIFEIVSRLAARYEDRSNNVEEARVASDSLENFLTAEECEVGDGSPLDLEVYTPD